MFDVDWIEPHILDTKHRQSTNEGIFEILFWILKMRKYYVDHRQEISVKSCLISD